MLDSHVNGYFKNGISIQDNATVFDVGANIGVFAVRSAQMGKDVKIYCFEPIPQIAHALKENAEMHAKEDIKVFNYGLSSEKGVAEFTYFPNTPAFSTSNLGDWEENPKEFSQAVKGTMKNPPESMKWMKWIPRFLSPVIAYFLTRNKSLVKCELNTLSGVIKDEEVDTIDLLKIDCEGAELEVLKGIDESDWSRVKAVIVEVKNVEGRLDKVISMLERHQFKNILKEQESGLESTSLYNLYCTR